MCKIITSDNAVVSPFFFLKKRTFLYLTGEGIMFVRLAEVRGTGLMYCGRKTKFTVWEGLTTKIMQRLWQEMLVASLRNPG